MGSIYKNRDVWYITVCHQNKRISKSLKTKDHKVDKQLIGGLKLQLGSFMIDTSIKNKLNKYKQEMLES